MSRLLNLEISAAWLASGAIMAMSDATISAVVVSICAAVPPTLVAYAALVQSRKAKEKAEETKTEVAVASQKSDTIISKTDEIHRLTNSHLSELTAQLKASNERGATLEKLVTSADGRIAGLEKIVIAISEHEKKRNGHDAPAPA